MDAHRNGRLWRRLLGTACCAALMPQLITQADDASPKWRQAFSIESFTPTFLTALEHPTEVNSSPAKFSLVSSSLQDVPLQPIPAQPNAPAMTPATNESRAVASIFRGDAPVSDLNVTPTRERTSVAADRVLGIESKARGTSDVGSLLGKSSQSRGVVTQKRNPIITDPRIRGSRVGQVAASGSHWVPARIDLDTAVSKLDSRLISDVVVVKGPYAVEYGPGFDFIDFQLAKSPRSQSGSTIGGSSGLEYQTNGQQWYGRQTLHYAEEGFGMRVGYGHRTGSDYDTGDGTGIPSSYNSRDLDLAFGFDISPDQSVEVFYLHQDQTKVELPGQAFDIDYAGTNAVEIKWTDKGVGWADQLEMETWFNETHLRGSANSSGKRRTFPYFGLINFSGTTDVESLSTGAKAQAVWELDQGRRLMAGTDVRFIRQELDEVVSFVNGFIPVMNANSPIPRAISADPGIFVTMTDETIDNLRLKIGARADVVGTEVIDDRNVLNNLSTNGPLTFQQIVGTNQLDQTFGLWSTFITADYSLDENWMVRASAGHGQRAPNLTELYAAESFMFLLQSGLNTVTGDPRLDPERKTQIDLGLEYRDEVFFARVNGFHAWVHDRITFENMNQFASPLNAVEQTNLKYVNTDLATLAGIEADTEYFVMPWLSVFSGLSYVEGTDRSRNGDFATQQAVAGIASTRNPGMVRGAFSTNGSTAEEEPLPGIPPLMGRAGLRLHGLFSETRWNIELAARMVDQQDRVARSLNETATAGYTVFDLRSYWQIKDNINLIAGVENFTHKQYREHFDFRNSNGLSISQPGANFYFGSQVTY